MMPKHIHYVETHGGGLAVLLAKDPEGISEVVNDINGDLMNFWNVMRCETEFGIFKRLCEATPFSEELWEKIVVGFPAQATVDRAWRFFIRCRQSLAGRMKSFAPLSKTRTRRKMNEQASAWITCVEGLEAAHKRLMRVAMLCQDAIDVIRSQDGKDTLFYCDPPYAHESRTSIGEYGANEMTTRQHELLLETLAGIKGKFMLSGYECEMYTVAMMRYGWKVHAFDLANNAAGGTSKRRMKEMVYCNF